jgi:hypothetical protein
LVDQNVIIRPNAIQLLAKLGLPVVAPMLVYDGVYSNYHAYTDQNGYYRDGDHYWKIIRREARGIHEVPVVNACYLVRNDRLEYLRYKDGSGRTDYVVFSETLRKRLIPQYIDNRYNYGVILNYDNMARNRIYEIELTSNKDFFLNLNGLSKRGILCDADWLSTYIVVEHLYLLKLLHRDYGFDIINCKHLDFENEMAITDLNSYDVLLLTYHWYRKLPMDLITSYKVYRMDDLLNNPTYDEIAKFYIRHADTVITPYAHVFHKYHEHGDVIMTPYSSAVETCTDYQNLDFNDDPKVKVLISGNLHETAPFRKYVANLNNENLERIVHPGYYQPNDPSNEAVVRDRYFRKLREYICCFTDALTFGYMVLKSFEIPSVGALLLADRKIEEEMNDLGFVDYETCIFCDEITFEGTVAWIVDPSNRQAVDRIRRTGMTVSRGRHLTRHRAAQINDLITQRAYGLSAASSVP